jgi:hypothetical protein
MSLGRTDRASGLDDLAMGQGKWFNITVLSGPRYGLNGDVPAPSVSNQWTTSPHC